MHDTDVSGAIWAGRLAHAAADPSTVHVKSLAEVMFEDPSFFTTTETLPPVVHVASRILTTFEIFPPRIFVT